MAIHAQIGNDTVLEFPDGTPDEIIDSAVRNHIKPPQTYGEIPSEDRTFLDRTNRQIQLAGRAGFEGLTSVAQLPTTAGSALMYGGIKGYNALTDSEIPTEGLLWPGAETSKVMDAVGMPKPEGAFERIESDVLKARAGTKPFFENPLLTTGAQTGALSSGTARELGFGPIGQTVAGVAGGVVGAPLINYAGKSITDAYRPFTEAGRNQIVADKLAELTHDPAGAAQNILNAPEYVPGSVPLAGTASQDTGLVGAQKAIQNFNKGAFNDRAIQQTDAQNKILNEVAGNPADLGKLINDRKNVTEPMYKAGTAASYDPNILQPVIADIEEQIKNVGASSMAGQKLSSMKSALLSEAGNPEGGRLGALVQLYKENRDNLSQNMLSPNAITPAVKGIINPINQRLGNTLARSNSDIAQADATFAQMSQPINQLEAGQAIKGQIQANSPNFDGQLPIIQPKLQQMMENGEVSFDGKIMPITDLSKSQQSGLTALQSDLNRNASANKVPARLASELAGLSTQGKIGGILSHTPYARKILENKESLIQEALVRAMLDNQKAAELLMQGKIPTNERLAEILMQSSSGTGLGGAISSGRGHQ